MPLSELDQQLFAAIAKYTDVAGNIASKNLLLLPEIGISDTDKQRFFDDTQDIKNSLKIKEITQVIEDLLKSGANVNAVNENGSTPLLVAVYAGIPPIVELLYRHGANPDFKAPNGETPSSAANRLTEATMSEEYEKERLAHGREIARRIGCVLPESDQAAKEAETAAHPDGKITFAQNVALLRASPEDFQNIADFLRNPPSEAEAPSPRLL